MKGTGDLGGAVAPGRDLRIDLLKTLASTLIVWHHLAFYGPMADVVAPWWPALFDALASHGRLAVPVFLVIAGYLAARGLAPQGRLVGGASPWALLGGRYVRLVLPYAVVLVLAVLAAALARAWMSHPATPPAPSVAQLVVHLLLLQDLLGVEALSAGIWYLAIDLQLYGVLLALACLSARVPLRQGPGGLLPWAVWMLAVLTLMVLNRIEALDVTALYFFGAYGLGALAAWARLPGGRLRFGLALTGAAFALALEFRSRVLLAGTVAMWLAMPAAAWLLAMPQALRAVLAWCADRSYALFLVHFPVSLVVNALFTRHAPASVAWQGLGLVLAWLGSVAVAAVLHSQVTPAGLRAVWARRRFWRAAAGGA